MRADKKMQLLLNLSHRVKSGGHLCQIYHDQLHNFIINFRKGRRNWFKKKKGYSQKQIRERVENTPPSGYMFNYIENDIDIWQSYRSFQQMFTELLVRPFNDFVTQTS